jgi:hypothetical protein
MNRVKTETDGQAENKLACDKAGEADLRRLPGS